MRIEQLIDRLTEQLPSSSPTGAWPIGARLGLASVTGGAFVFLIIWLFFSRSPHIAHGPTAAIAFTVIAAAALALAGFRLCLDLARPEACPRMRRWLLAALFVVAGVGLELYRTPPTAWSANLMGTSPLACFFSVLLLSLPITLAALYALRRGASTQPFRSGASSGLLGAGITTVLYTLHCPEGSLLFIAVWHGAAITAMALLAGYLGVRLLRW